MSASEKPDFDKEFKDAVAKWRENHQLKEDDAAFLLVELFRIHQRHWDEIRRREFPSLESLRADITKLAEAARTFQGQGAGLVEVVQKLQPLHAVPRITRTAAFFATIAGGLAGYLLGKGWL